MWWVARQLPLHSNFVSWSTFSPPSPKQLEANPVIAQNLFSPWCYIDQGHFLVKNSFSSVAVSAQETAVTFPDHKVMHFDRRHRASPSNHAAQTTAHCSPEACCSSCCLITFSRAGAERHSGYQKGRKAVLVILWQSSARSNIHSRLVL